MSRRFIVSNDPKFHVVSIGDKIIPYRVGRRSGMSYAASAQMFGPPYWPDPPDTLPIGLPVPEKPKGICSGCGEKNEYVEESDWMCWACRNGWKGEDP